jgi:hypothetical protein
MSEKSTTHESFYREEAIKGPSDRHFALTFSAIFFALSAYGVWKGWTGSMFLVVFAIAFCVAGIAAPQLVRPLNRAWLQLGLVMYRIVNPVVMGLMYFGMIVPMGMLLRLMGKDLLHKGIEPTSETYWVDRQPPGPSPESLKNQF